MTEEMSEAIALWLFLPSMGVILVILFARMFGTPTEVRQHRRTEQLKTLRELARSPGPTLELDWLRCKELAFAELRRELGRKGWRFVDEEITCTGWLLHFSREEGEPAKRTDSGQQLRRELREATLNADGFYPLGTSRYADLSTATITQMVRGTGWKEADHSQIRRGEVVRLTRPGTTVVSPAQESFTNASDPAELRDHPAVRARAAEIERLQGFDPLSPQVLERAREQHRAWGAKFNRQGRLAMLFGFVSLFMVLGTLASTEHEYFVLLLGVSAVVWTLFGVFLVRVVLVRERRNRDVRPVLDAYAELETPARSR
ncbi:hypothetical protein [Saccharomonospora iraqiensis]|uniref:hypothetical protein n=1 Tax=Saccharomonospora iraqiensis TaxID=52698 RepID=UPI00022E82CF|nr:hypothetical protein [Saccharomonospora iraqiensis]